MSKYLFVRTVISLFLLFVSILPPAYTKETLTVGILVSSGEQRSIMSALFNDFNKNNPDINIELTMLPDVEFKPALKTWLDSSTGPDIIHWQAGERLYQYVRKNQIKSIDELWEKRQLSTTLSQGSVSAVSWKNSVYGIPISYYQWGMYYRKSLFDRLNITPPKTWSEFLNVCKTLQQNNITPITIGNKYQWPSAAWFDYLNLRINGLAFHSQLLRGEVLFTDPKVRSVFTHWKELLEAGYFVEHSNVWKWDEAMPFMYHRLAGMTLIGNFFSGRMPELLKDDFGFFRFPIINPNIPVFEEAPLDIFMVPHYTKMNETVERFLAFVASNQFQEPLNNKLGMIAPNTQASSANDYFSNAGKKMLSEAKGLSQYFDRDTNTEMSNEAIKIFTDFIANRDIELTITKLEQARQKHL